MRRICLMINTPSINPLSIYQLAYSPNRPTWFCKDYFINIKRKCVRPIKVSENPHLFPNREPVHRIPKTNKYANSRESFVSSHAPKIIRAQKRMPFTLIFLLPSALIAVRRVLILYCLHRSSFSE